MKALITLPLILAAAPVLAVPVTSFGASQPPATSPRPAAQPRRVEGMSDAGNDIFAKAQQTPDPAFIALLRQQRVLHDQLLSAATASTIDVDRIESIQKQQEDVAAQLRVKFDERNLAVLRQLSDADRGPFLRALMMPAAPH